MKFPISLLLAALFLISCGHDAGDSPSPSVTEFSTSQDVWKKVGPIPKNPDEYVPDELLVKFKENNASLHLAAHAGVRAQKVREFGGLRIHHVKVPSGAMQAAMQKYADDPQVEYVQPNYVYKMQTVFPVDTSFNNLWGLNNTGQTVDGLPGTAGADIMAPAAWDISTGSADVVIAVVDSGVAYDHPDLAANIWSNAGETNCADGIDNDGNGFIDDCRGWDFVNNDTDPTDFTGHGTHVAGIIAAVGNNQTGVTGVLWTAKIMPVRIMDADGYGTSARSISGINYARRNGARIINFSVVGYAFDQALLDAITAFGQTDGLFIAAAGNEENNNDTQPAYPAGYNSPYIISVAASDQNDALADFSNYGATSVHVAAPGVNIYSAYPARQTVFSEDFESGAPGWTTGGTSSWTMTTESSHSPTRSATDSAGGNYTAYASSEMRSPAINLSDKKGCKLTYYAMINTEPGHDFFYVEASTNGTTWTTLNGKVYSGYIGTYTKDEVDISNYDNQPMVYVRFKLIADGLSSYDGVHIDDVSLTCLSSAFSVFDYKYLDGTSMATPYVAGLAGLIKAAAPDLTNLEIINVILSTVDTKAALTGKVSTGGRINAYNALIAVTPPLAASALTATASSSTVVRLSWTDNSANETGFKVDRKTDASGTYVHIGTASADSTTYEDGGLTGGTTYYYRVQATNLRGDSPSSNEADATTQSVASVDADGSGGGAGSGGGGGCFIATAAYGSYLDPHVMVLRRFRDAYLLTNSPGRAIVGIYYKYSPPMAEFIRQHELLRTLTRIILTPVVFAVVYLDLSVLLLITVGLLVLKMRHRLHDGFNVRRVS